jgi:hypothetical protein
MINRSRAPRLAGVSGDPLLLIIESEGGTGHAGDAACHGWD